MGSAGHRVRDPVSNTATDIAAQLVRNRGQVPNTHRAALGIGAVTVVDQNGQPAGVAVGSVVPGGPAAAAGIKRGDVITAVNNTPVSSAPSRPRNWPGSAPDKPWVPRTVSRPLIRAFAASRPRSHRSQAAQQDRSPWPFDSRT